jgi:GntP family gluconate:H+ symporter
MSILTISALVILSIVLIIVLTSIVRLNAFLSLFVTALLLAVTTLPDRSVVEILQQGFGTTLSSIGFLIIFGAIIAVVLDQTGGSVSIATFILRKTGAHKAAPAIGITGFVTGLPIFCDSGYIILSGLNGSFSSKGKVALPLIAFVLATSLYSVHCLVPTHPGALAASGIMNANLGYLILLGTLFAIPATLIAYWWIKWQTSKQLTQQATVPFPPDERVLPPVSLALLPILTPIVLIAIRSMLTIFEAGDSNMITRVLTFIGQPVMALLTGVVLSFPLLGKPSVDKLNQLLESAIQKAGPILIVTAAGGMLGMVIKETGVGAYAGSLMLHTGIGLAVPFLIAFLMKTAQGSSTVAIITAASLVVPMLPSLGLDSENGKLLAMLAMGGGSMMVSHANDSYFWVVSRFSGVSVDTTLRIYSSATVVMGVTVFLLVWISSFLML